MSVNATRFAWECDLSKTTKRSAKRLVLLALADRANKENTCFPSIARVVKDTGMDRKTVMNTINDLITLGLVSDTGERKGGTNQVRVLKINVYTVKQESYPQYDQEMSNKQCEISEGTVVNLPINGVEFPSNSGKFGTRNLKQSNLESKNNLYEDFENLDEEILLDVSEIKRRCKDMDFMNNLAEKRLIPKNMYGQYLKDKQKYDEINKSPVVSKSMRESFEKAGEIRREVVKGVPKELLSDPRLSKMLKSKQTKTKFY